MAVIEEIDNRLSPIITLMGRVDSAGSQRVSDVMHELVASGYGSPLVDLAGVSFMDHDGLESVIGWRRQFGDVQTPLEIITVNPSVRSVFQSAGYEEIVEKSEDRPVPLVTERQPITDCCAEVADWAACSFSVAATLSSCRVVRDRIGGLMSGMGFSFEERGDIKMAVGEAISNAIRHGAKERPRETVAVRCLISPRMLVVEVCDDGLGFDADAYESPREGELLEGGMGINFMRQCMDEVTFDFSSGTIARLIKHVCI